MFIHDYRSHLCCPLQLYESSALYHALKNEKWAKPFIVHIAQHYDLNMSDVFFTNLHVPDPDYHLRFGSATYSEQSGKIMMAYEKKLLEYWPDMAVVVGDVNSTRAGNYCASKLNIKFVNLESDLRFNDRSMLEESNRIVTESLAVYL
jgi:UDP-N-acetylglucosamine 2-epimerase (non-hydrolysing)